MNDLSKGDSLSKEDLEIIKREIAIVNRKRREFLAAFSSLIHFFKSNYPQGEFSNDDIWQSLWSTICDIKNDSLEMESFKREHGFPQEVIVDDKGGKRKKLNSEIYDMYNLLTNKNIARKQEDTLQAFELGDWEKLRLLISCVYEFLNDKEIGQDNDTRKIKQEYEDKVQAFERQKHGESLFLLIDETSKLHTSTGVRRTYESRMRHDREGLYKSNKLCMVCNLPLSGRQLKYCSDKCREVAKNKRKDPEKKALANFKYLRDIFSG